ncbi:MAG: hypothetical protein H5U07_05045 [Candidatus Aminicenantes bacterium]|nr:hypothetical protein [Candidatus Aminicenantes bacterium]
MDGKKRGLRNIAAASVTGIKADKNKMTKTIRKNKQEIFRIKIGQADKNKSTKWSG